MMKLKKMISRVALLAVLVAVANANPPPPEVPSGVPGTPAGPDTTEWTWSTPDTNNYVSSTLILDNGFGELYYRVTVIYMIDGAVVYHDVYTMMTRSGGGNQNVD